MDKSRSIILDRIISNTITQEEFNYDKLQAPPLMMLLSPYDIAELNRIASSVKLSDKLKQKYQMIDNIMTRRGFVKMAAGTNRVVYKHPEDSSFLIKIAVDSVGMGDNPAEYRNQFIFKPFVTKCFEVSPCGTVGVFERVDPILSREEFLSVAQDIFNVISEWFIGEYVLADFGSSFFMNWGVRHGFGPVLLDYPYMYKLDGDKLYCNAPNPNSPTGKCDGIIDYDDGYNFLYCTKCGVKYRAQELAKKIEKKEIIVRSTEGDVPAMRFKISGGTYNLEERTVTLGGNNFNGRVEVKTINDKPKIIRSETPVNTVDVPKIIKEEPKVVERRTPAPVEKPATTRKRLSVNGASESSGKVSPISFGAKIKPEKEETSPVKNIENAVKQIVSNIGKIDLANLKSYAITFILDTILDEIIENGSVDDIFAASSILISKLTTATDKVYDKSSEDEKDAKVNNIVGSYGIKEFIKKWYRIVILADDSTLEYALRQTKYPEDGDVISGTIALSDIIDDCEDTNGYCSEDEVDEESTEVNNYILANGKVDNLEDVFIDAKPHKVMFVMNKDGKYILDKENHVIAIDMIDSKDLDSHKIVSSDWLQNLISLTTENAHDTEPVDVVEDEEDDEADMDEEDFHEEPVDADEPQMKSVRGDMFNSTSTEEDYSEKTEAFCKDLQEKMLTDFHDDEDQEGE